MKKFFAIILSFAIVFGLCAQDGVVIKEGSPFDFTIVCSCSSEHYSYFARKAITDL